MARAYVQLSPKSGTMSMYGLTSTTSHSGSVMEVLQPGIATSLSWESHCSFAFDASDEKMPIEKVHSCVSYGSFSNSMWHSQSKRALRDQVTVPLGSTLIDSSRPSSAQIFHAEEALSKYLRACGGHVDVGHVAGGCVEEHAERPLGGHVHEVQ